MPHPRGRGGTSYRQVGPGDTMSGVNGIAHGVDIVDCARLAEIIDRHGERFLRRVFTPRELAYCRGRKRQVEHLAGRFAAKEAVLKALGTGWRGGINWTDVEVVNDASGRPRVVLTGRCRQIAEGLGLAAIAVSISHTRDYAIGSAIGSARSP